MTSLINIPSDMRQRINERLYTTQLCLEHVGIANPSPSDLRKWKETWNTDFSVQISSITKAQEVIKQQDIPTLLYDIRNSHTDFGIEGGTPEWWGNAYGDAGARRYIVFRLEEDFVLFKLLYKNT